jgi:hypothetical protein
VRPPCSYDGWLTGSLNGFKVVCIGLSLVLLIAGSDGYIPSMPVLADALETAEVNLSFFLRMSTSAKSSL